MCTNVNAEEYKAGVTVYTLPSIRDSTNFVISPQLTSEQKEDISKLVNNCFDGLSDLSRCTNSLSLEIKLKTVK